MTERQAALSVLVSGVSAERGRALETFYDRYAGNALVIDKWFQTQALAFHPDTVEMVEALGNHADFTLANPNRARALFGAFAANQWAFNRADGKGYKMIADIIIALDKLNPQTAARLVPPLGRWRRFDAARGALMRAELERIAATPNLSKDVLEQATKSLA
jgi:aminopeptidase N